jgi:diadenylate cyclase
MSSWWNQLMVLSPGWLDLVEILIVAALFYRALVLIQRTRAMQMLLGVLLLAGTYMVARLLGLALIRQILETLFQYGAIAALIVFQPELRQALARLGGGGMARVFGQNRVIRLFSGMESSQVVDEVVAAVEQLARTKTGAIIAVERDVSLEDYCGSGRPVGARVSTELLTTIFTPYTPLHDGAVIIVGDQVKAAGVILPLTQNPVSDRSLGTRHRAAIGLSEETDALVVVVSEETARISLAQRGRLELGVDAGRLRSALEHLRTEPTLPLAAG